MLGGAVRSFLTSGEIFEDGSSGGGGGGGDVFSCLVCEFDIPIQVLMKKNEVRDRRLNIEWVAYTRATPLLTINNILGHHAVIRKDPLE